MLYGNGTTRLETYSRSVGDSETDTWKFLRTKAKNCNTSVFEAGYYFLVDKFGASAVNSTLTTNPNAGYLAVLASPDNQVVSDAHLYVKNNSDTMYTPKSLVKLCKTVELTQEVLITDTTITVKDASNITTSTFLKIDNELMYITSILGKVLTVNRAILDTVPDHHTSDSEGLVFSKQNVLNNLYNNTNNIDVKVVTNAEGNLLSLSNTTTSNVVFDSRAIRPYPPINVKIDGTYNPTTHLRSQDISISWKVRNRTTTDLDSYYSDVVVSPESGTTYSLDVLSPTNVVLYSAQGLTTTTHTVPKTSLTPATTHKIRLKAVRGGFESRNYYEHSLYVVPTETTLTGIITATGLTGTTISTASITAIVDTELTGNLLYNGTSLTGVAPPNSTITVEVI